TTPGEGFGAPDRLRLSYAASLTELEKGFRRIKDFLAGQPPFPDN
ncbi:MAG: pyridoxal phosphate-dependent aminotransferase, partial [Deltaproteobacteria bacterium]|nr:pyridoxal phosphate-dependent aminotransferase [Deltaproteobacteria bacterium]